jgi:branched-chain amino acid transport system permease protein
MSTELKVSVGVFVVLLATLPITFPVYFYRYMVIALMFAALSLSWNILGGYAGYLSFGHMSFFGIGAYTTAILVTKYDFSPFLTVPLASLLGAAVMLVALYSFIRLEEAYFAIATLAFNFALFYLALVLPQTNGASGISVPLLPYSPLDVNKIFFGIFASFLIVLMVIIQRMRSSKLGYELVAMREDGVAAETLGVDTVRARLIAGLVSAGATSLVGSIYPLYITYIDPGVAFNIEWSVLLVVMVVFGGVGTLAGPIIGAFVFESITEAFTYFTPTPQLSHVFIGLCLMLLLLLLPAGVYGTLKNKFGRGIKLERS